ncbi:acyltransferase [Thaumasiovibrio sp. DFM-14]|uniref:acyltransferase n=1 Tax=Thaumasiovibrio sp. DFM-14 TaxID=3384792 RepID=UPI0039A18A0C
MLAETMKKHLSHQQLSSVRHWYHRLRSISCPSIPYLHACLYHLHKQISALFHAALQRGYYTPLFLSQIKAKPKQLYLYSGMPLLCGKLQIQLGEGCRISGITTFSGRSSSTNPQLIIGNNVGISWQTTIAVGNKVILDDNVRLAGKVFIAGYPGHPIDPARRANGDPDDENQVGDVHLERNVWVGTGATLMGGVSIGENSIVAAGSVVTRSMPANVLIGGNPAIVIKQLEY